MRPIFSLPARLAACAEAVRPQAKLADIGTDHAYLPIFLAKKEYIHRAVAADIREGPLCVAAQNIKRYRVENLVEIRKSDGLDNIKSEEADDIVIAGMGAELIVEIIHRAPWLKDKKKQLILGPVSHTERLRCYLAEEQFEIKERAVLSENRLYTVIRATFCGTKLYTNELYPYVGGLTESLDYAAHLYIQNQINHIKNQIIGLKIRKDTLSAAKLSKIVQELEKLDSGG